MVPLWLSGSLDAFWWPWRRGGEDAGQAPFDSEFRQTQSVARDTVSDGNPVEISNQLQGPDAVIGWFRRPATPMCRCPDHGDLRRDDGPRRERGRRRLGFRKGRDAPLTGAGQLRRSRDDGGTNADTTVELQTEPTGIKALTAVEPISAGPMRVGAGGGSRRRPPERIR